MSSEELFKRLQNKGVNIYNDKIQNAMKKVQRGDKDAFKTLYASISLYKSDKSSELKIKTLPKDYSAIKDERVQTNFSKKKIMCDHPNNSLVSKSEIFDWKGNLINEIKQEILTGITAKDKIPQQKRRNVSHIFDNLTQKSKPEEISRKQNHSNKKEDLNIFKKEKIIEMKIGKKVSKMKNSSLEIKQTTILGGIKSKDTLITTNLKGKKPAPIKNITSRDNILEYSRENSSTKFNSIASSSKLKTHKQNKSIADFNRVGITLDAPKVDNETLS